MQSQENSVPDYLARWKACGPNKGLTWDVMLTGDNFISLAQKRKIFGDRKSILELGPGYGRILKSFLDKQIPFSYYTGIDISKQNLTHLRNIFQSDKIDFVEGGFLDVELNRSYDIVLSSLVLKHQFPTWEMPLRNILRFLNRGAILFFDLTENRDTTSENSDISKGPKVTAWEKPTNTYIGWYTQKEVRKILDNLKLELIAFDHVTHLESMGDRLVVIARKN